MRLLHVKAVLEREKNVQHVAPKTEVLRELDDRNAKYAIVSHRWGSEVSYEEVIGLMVMEEQDREEVRRRDGYRKIIRSCEQAMRDGYTWLWVDTCCIDKRSSAELSEAINSMYRWYQNSQKCYAYLNDVDESTFPTARNDSKFGESNGWPEWFERGWTLQELIAPKKIEFFNKNWVSIGSKATLADVLQRATHIPREVLLNGLAAQRPCIAQVMSWAADRKTTRVEDRAYSLMGLFGVNMPMLYGEGQKAFQRLQLEIIRASSDHTIFAWDPHGKIRRPGSVLADDPSYFRHCHYIKKVEPARFAHDLIWYTRRHELSNHWFNVTRRRRLASWHNIMHSQQYRTISITNAGVQVWLPIIPYHGSLSTVRAIVARYEIELITIDLAFYGSTFERSFDPTGICKRYPEFKALYLAYTDETRHNLILDDTNASYHGFTRCGTFPREITGDTVTLSSHASDLIVVVYANSDARSRFAVGLGYYSNQGWVHVTCDESSANQEEIGTPWGDFAKKAYVMMWSARAHHAQQDISAHGYNGNFVNHAHFPRSIWAARVVWGGWNTGNVTVVVDVEQCPGCCVGPLAWTATSNYRDGLDMPGLMMIALPLHLSLSLDGRLVWLHECPRGTLLGDYGDCVGGNFKRHGNIFEDIQTLGIDSENLAYHPVENRFSSASDEEFAMKILSLSVDLAFSRPIALSLPNNQHFVLLLKALSTRLSGKHLVITVVRYSVDHNQEMREGSGEDSAMDNNSRSTKPGDFITLCTVASPQVWRRQPACEQRRKQFREIREHFHALVNAHRPAGTESRPEPMNGQVDRAIEFFSKAFGLECLKNYVGEITSLKEFPLKLETESRREGPRGIAQRNDLSARPSKSFISWAMKCNPFQDRRQPKAALGTVLGVRFRPLLKGRQGPGYAAESRTEYDVKSISKTLSIGLLKHISAFVYPDRQNGRGRIGVDYDRQVNTHSMVQEIKGLQAELGTTKDEDEQRALEEDVTGKILWLFWCVICSEVDQLLPKVLRLREGPLEGLWEIGKIMKGTLHTDPDDDQAHLLRIMADAGAGTSKHRLWLAARAAQHMNRSGTIDKFNLDTPGAVPKIGHQALSTLLASIL